MSEILKNNALDLEKELNWFIQVRDTRFKLYFGQESTFASVLDINPPDLSDSPSLYADFLRTHEMDFMERLMLVLALVPHIRPRLLDVFFTKNVTFDRPFTEFGGIVNDESGGFFPTLETLSFLVAGSDLEMHFKVLALLNNDHFFTRQQIFDFQVGETLLSILKMPLQISREYISHFTTGAVPRLQFSAHFPTQQMTSQAEWDDLVLAPGTLAMVKEIETWIHHGATLMQAWGMSGKLRPGYRAFFHGPSGTGKTMTASLLGKSTGYDVYHIDLSTVISKYIGETEKNLARVFDKAAPQNGILFFDEADALFGKRRLGKRSGDRLMNQGLAYLLQRIENYDGLTILASNSKGTIDKAVARRFESIIHFPMPDPGDRLRIWESNIPSEVTLAPDVDLSQIAERFELSGGAIMNVIRFASLAALSMGANVIRLADLREGIRRELIKEGTVI
jgi:hypothetical protein